jgi:uncharacterized protein (DUF1330 family)
LHKIAEGTALTYDIAVGRLSANWEDIMKTRYTVALSMLAGAAIGALCIGGLYAQGKTPGAYAVITFTDLGDPAAFKENVLDKAVPTIAKHGGTRLVGTNDFTILREGPTPWALKRYVLIAFDNVQQAKAWDMKAANAYVDQHTKGRAYVVEALKQ